MFERLSGALSARFMTGARDTGLVRWAHARSLALTPAPGSGWAMAGRLLDRPFRAERAASTRDYINGMALLARVDLGLTFEGSVVVMNRSLKRALEAQANSLYAQATNGLQTTAHDVPQEVRWLSMYRDAGWGGPEHDFWRRYAVLTNAPETARHWLSGEGISRLMQWPPEGDESIPVSLMLMRGKTYLRMACPVATESASALAMLDLLEHLSVRAVELFRR